MRRKSSPKRSMGFIPSEPCSRTLYSSSTQRVKTRLRASTLERSSARVKNDSRTVLKKRSILPFARLLGGHDESKLMLLARAGLFEGLRARGPTGVVQHSLGAILLDAVAFDVTQVERGGLGARCGEPNDVRLDDDAASARPRQAPRALGAASRASDVPARERQDGIAQRARVAGLGALPLAEARPKNRQFVAMTQSWHRFSCVSSKH